MRLNYRAGVATVSALLVLGSAACADPGAADGATPAGGSASGSSASGSSASGSSGSGATAPRSSRPASPAAGGAAAALASLRVSTARSPDPYRRSAFGAGWKDPDRNGCDARNDTLRRDLTDLVVKPGTGGCVVLSGVLHDPYTGRTVDFVKGPRSAEVQIDHVVPLSLAWTQGAAQWSSEERVRFANDPLDLLATTQQANEEKKGSDAAEWLPPDAGYRCAYVARQIAVKARYDLPVFPDEKAAMERVLSTCPGQVLP